MRLWKYNKVTGYWVLIRTVSEQTAKQWIDIYKADEPNEQFKISFNRPK